LGGEVSTGTDYAHFLEFGTRYMPARPYMEPALLSVKPKFHNEIEEMFRRVH
jgi:HK97 gp10 family phage protein